MPGYYSARVRDFLAVEDESVVEQLSLRLAEHFNAVREQTLFSWRSSVPILRTALDQAARVSDAVLDWGIIVEFPLLRLQKRLDVVVLAGSTIVVVEFKVGAGGFAPADARQVEDYALDLRDFHEPSRELRIWPILCATNAKTSTLTPIGEGVLNVGFCTESGLATAMIELASDQFRRGERQIDLSTWQAGAYRPVPTIVQAAELLFADHDVKEIASAASNPENLGATTDALIEVIERAQTRREHIVVFVTGVPGSGKTLVGLNAVHDERFSRGGQCPGAYLSGNSPLVRVLRVALAEDRVRRTKEPKKAAERLVHTKVQTLMDFLREYLKSQAKAPSDHVIIFDEAQRAWDAAYGKQKFNREKSEASLFLEIMGRHDDWTVIIALVGGGQEINRGELGLSEWGRAIAAERATAGARNWIAIASPEVIRGDDATAWQRLFDGPAPAWAEVDARLHLSASVRSYGCEVLAGWVNALLRADIDAARALASSAAFPVLMTRDLEVARAWLRGNTRGLRRCGLVASSGARRLRAEGLGVSLGADNLDGVAHWFLRPRGDIRSSYALEVTANEYASQGLELDYVGVCWGGDMTWNSIKRTWAPRKLGGTEWQTVKDPSNQTWILNKYRVLLTRARLGTIIWVPPGDPDDPTRPQKTYDEVADVLMAAGVATL